MKSIGVYVAVALLFIVAFAARPDAKAAKKGTHAMTGCLQKGEGNMFTLTNVEGNGPKTVEIVGAAPAANLAAHVGHRIEITGTGVSPKTAAKAEGNKKNMKEEAGEHHMRVQSVKMIAAKCP